MALLDKTGIENGQTIVPSHVTNVYDALNSSGSFSVQATGSFSGSFTGVFHGIATTASFAISASHEIIKEVSSSHANFADSASIVTDASQPYITTFPSAITFESAVTASSTINIGPATLADGISAFAQGSGSKATGDYSNAIGRGTRAIGFAAHAQGLSTRAEGSYSHAEGRLTKASGSYSHAEGHLTTASGDYAHAGGHGTIANGTYQRVIGKFNIATTNALDSAAFIIGDGADANNRSNILFAGNNKIELNAPVTASVNISSSANMFADRAIFNRVTTPLISNTTTVQIDNNLSGSAVTTASFGHFIGDGAGLTNVPINSPTGTVSGSTQLIELGAAITGSDVIFAHITASGNISASGNFIGELTGIGGAVTGITSLLATDIKIGEDNETKIDFEDVNKINFYANNSKEVELAENSLSPGSSDGTALGTTSLQWSDLFLAEGGVINFDNGDVTITQTGNNITIAGGSVSASGDLGITATASAAYFSGDGSTLTNLQRPITTELANFSASTANAGHYIRTHGAFTCSIGTTAATGIAIGTEFEFFQTSSVGYLCFTTASGVTLNSKSGKIKLAGQFSGATLKKIGTDEYDLIGDLG